MPQIDFYYDIASSYSYLAAVRVDDVLGEAGATVRWRPFLLGGVFKATGNVMPGANPAKAQYMLADLGRLAKRYGVPFALPPDFPPSSLHVMRILAWADEVHGHDTQRALAKALFARYWGAGEPMTPEMIGAAVVEVGLSPEAAMAATADPAIKERLKTITGEAIDGGAFGAPALFWGEALYWGNDRVDALAADLEDAR